MHNKLRRRFQTLVPRLTKIKQELHHSKAGNQKLSRSFTTTTRHIKNKAGASPQQQYKARNKQELHHSNKGNRKASRSFTTATRDIKRKQEHHHSDTANQKKTGASPQQHGNSKSKQELHHNDTANRKTSKSFTTATRQTRK